MVWVPSEADPPTRKYESKIVYWEGKGTLGEEEGNELRKAVIVGCVVKSVTAVGSWSFVLSGKLWRSA